MSTTTDRKCVVCGKHLPAGRAGGRTRVYCSEACRRAKYRGECESCGKPTSYATNGPHRYCRACSPLARRIWTDDAVLEAIRSYGERYGRAPTAVDWNPSHARSGAVSKKRLAEIERRWKDGRYPLTATVRSRFGSWSKAIRKAGYNARRQGHGKPSARSDRVARRKPRKR